MTRGTRRFQGSFRQARQFLCWLLVGLGVMGIIASCSRPSVSGAQAEAVELTLVSYAVTRSAYEQIIPQFAAKWNAEHNQTVYFNYSYGSSGAQARAIVDGLGADIAALALELDIQRIEQAGLITPGWQQELPNSAVPYRSVAALVTRAGNPLQISNWRDLAKDTIRIVTANPKTSGGARWNFLALWGAITQTGGSEAEALDFTTQVFRRVPVLTRDSRESSDAFFQQGQGDVLINYENEMILANRNGESLPPIIPTNINISIDSPVAVVDANVDRHGTREVAEAFVQFLFTPEAQRAFAEAGFRPVDPQVAQEFADQYPQIKQLFTVQDLGGWQAVQAKFFDTGGIFDQIQTQISQQS